MNAAQHHEIAGYRELYVDLAAGLLVAGIEIELIRFHVGVVEEIGIVVDDLDHVAAFDLEIRWIEFTTFFGEGKLRWVDGAEGRSAQTSKDGNDKKRPSMGALRAASNQ